MADAPPLRIALVTPEYPGCGISHGIGRYVQDLARALVNAGHSVSVFAATEHGIFEPLADPPKPGRGPRVGSLLIRSLVIAPWLRKCLRAFRPDVVELSNWGGLHLAVGGDSPVVVRLSTSAIDAGGSRRDPVRLARWALELATVQRARLVIADSAAMAERGRKLYHRSPDAVIHHGWIGGRRRPAPTAQPEALFVGRLEPRKGIDVLLDAWPAVLKRIPNARLHVVGAGSLDRALPPNVEIHGWLSDGQLLSLRQRCRVQVVPSRFESFGLVVLEAWAQGMAVVASDAGGLAEVVEKAGILVRAGSLEELATALAEALDADRAIELAERGAERLDLFSESAWVRASVSAYRRAIAAGAGA